MPPRSAAERWAVHVLKGCDADGDLKTLASWARLVGVSYTTLCESCRILSLRPHDARDLMRALRALFKSAEYECPPEVLLDLSDRRTLRTFLQRSGDGFRRGSGAEWIDVFLRHQTFVPSAHMAVTTLRALCAERAGRMRPATSVECSDQIRCR